MARFTGVVELVVERIVAGGDAITRLPDGRVALVEGALPGERVRVETVANRADHLRARVVEVTDRYLHAEFTTPVFRFVDDVEFLLAADAIHVRSASRLGWSDFGVNRRRVERLRRAFAAS